MRRLYHLSKDRSLKKLTPRVPESICSVGEDNITPRVCFSTSIINCLLGLRHGGEFYVYVPYYVDERFVQIPTDNQVAAASLSKEIWYTREINVKCIGKIQTPRFYDYKTLEVNKLGKYITMYHYSYIFYKRVFDRD